MDFETSKVHRDTWNRYLMLRFVQCHIPGNTIRNLELLQSYKAIRRDLLLPSTTTLSNICCREHRLNVDAIQKQLLSWSKVSLALDRWTATNKLTITSVFAYYIDQNWLFRELQLTCNEGDSMFFSGFKSWFRMIGQGPTYLSKASRVFEVRALFFSAGRRPFHWNYDR